MNLHPDALALLDEVICASTGARFPVGLLRSGYLPADVSADVLYPREHLRLQYARLGTALGSGPEGPPASASMRADEWLVTTSRLPDGQDWARFSSVPPLPAEVPVEPLRPRERPVVGAAAAARILGVSRDTVDARIKSLPPERRPTDMGQGGKRSRWWWPSAEAVVAWWESGVGTKAHAALVPSTTPEVVAAGTPEKQPRRRRSPKAAPPSLVGDAVDIWAGLRKARNGSDA